MVSSAHLDLIVLPRTDHDDLRVIGTATGSGRRDGHLLLRDCLPHDWGCPVLAKLEPESVAWTCAKCGMITMVPAGTPRPAPGIGTGLTPFSSGTSVAVLRVVLSEARPERPPSGVVRIVPVGRTASELSRCGRRPTLTKS